MKETWIDGGWREYYKCGVFHRLEGPAMIHVKFLPGRYFIEGVHFLDPDAWKAEVEKLRARGDLQ